MSLFVKICGITNATAAHAAVESGADAVGFVFADSPRRVDPAQARAIGEGLPSGVLRVAVFKRPTLADMATVLDEFDADVVQADHQSLAGYDGRPTLPVYREPLTGRPDHSRFLYEGVTSGVGARVDESEAARVATLGEMVLAGGLDPGNVGAAITAIRPFGVDVSTGVETAPGIKSPELIGSFVAAARAAAERLVTA